MLWTSLKRIWRSGFTNFTRGGIVSLAPVIIMTSTLFVIGSLIFLGASFNFLLESWENKIDMIVYFVPEASEADILELQEKLVARPEVAEVEYVSREAALERFKMDNADDELIMQSLDVIGDNPFGANLNIRAVEIAQIESVSQFLETDSALSSAGVSIIDDVNYDDNKEIIDELTNIIDTVDVLSFVVILVFVVLSIIITFTTITLAIHLSKDEIGVMRLVGASDRHIRGPFVVQGMIMGAIAAISVLIIFYPVTYWLGPMTEYIFDGLNILDYYAGNFLQMFVILLISGVTLGGLSSYLAVRKHIKF